MCCQSERDIGRWWLLTLSETKRTHVDNHPGVLFRNRQGKELLLLVYAIGLLSSGAFVDLGGKLR